MSFEHLKSKLVIRQLGRLAYEPVWKAMQQYTDLRDESDQDEVWFVEHEPVFTQGQAGKAEHVLAPGDIPVVKVDRGGQVTYHGPGQQVIYFLINIKRKKIGVRQLVTHIENLVVDTLARFDIAAAPRADAPGVYVEQSKICSLGLRIRRGCSFHGLALNVNMDLSPFSRINPCGYQGMAITQMSDFNSQVNITQVEPVLIEQLSKELGYNSVELVEGF
jgi:lipoyl(octanoyl) transferase